jgi:hypothetical protein
MRHSRHFLLLGAVLLLLLVACDSYTQSGVRSSNVQDMTGGKVTTRVGKANGTITEEIEVEDIAGLILDSTVTLSVGGGSFKIELLGEDDQVTLTLEAHEGQSVEGQGWMVTDSFGAASYRVSAVDAEDVEYVIEYVFR